MPYFQQALDNFCGAWHCNGALYFGAPKTARDWVVTFNNVSDVPEAIGYHESVGSRPEAFVSVQTAVQAGLPWGVVFTHELFEMLGDPEASAADVTSWGIGQFGENSTFYFREVCDPVQSEAFRLGPVRISDFVYRSWFTPGAAGPYDAMRAVGQPLTLAPNSYASFYKDGYWQQTDTFGGVRTWDTFRH